MKIRVLSDLHTEFGPYEIVAAGEDLLILAGDIGVHTRAMGFVKQTAQKLGVPIIIIAGNHEFYQSEEHEDSHTWEDTLDAVRAEADHIDVVVKGEVTFLEDTAVLYEGVRVIGATLWTDMKLFGDNPLIPYHVWCGMGDFRLIMSKKNHPLSIDQVIERHTESLRFITETLQQPHDGPTVVVTHHAPSSLSVSGRYRHNPVSAGYASLLEDLILDMKPNLWLHGHTHTSFDYELGETRVVCNPRGYEQHELNSEFNPRLILEVP